MSWIERYSQKIRGAAAAAAIKIDSQILEVGPREYRANNLFRTRMNFDQLREVWTDRVLAAALATRKGAFIDVGANIGQSLMKLLSIDPGRTYIGFEPQIDCSFYLSQFIKSNGLQAHSLLPIGLSNRTGVLQLLKRDDQSDQTASMIEGFRPDDFYAVREAIYVARGDDVFSGMKIDDISTIKIDVEGGELEVMEGMPQTLARAPFVFFEVLNNYLVVTEQPLDEKTIMFRQHRNERMMKLLHDAGYQVFNIRPGDRILEVSQFKPERTGDMSIVDHIAVHGDYRAEFIKNYRGTVVPRETA